LGTIVNTWFSPFHPFGFFWPDKSWHRQKVNIHPIGIQINGKLFSTEVHESTMKITFFLNFSNKEK